MKIKVRFFAGLREAMGKAEVQYELPAGARVKDALDLLADQHPALRRQLDFAQVALNLEYASGESELREGDEIALVPPVGGG